jgi:hypothetical protein
VEFNGESTGVEADDGGDGVKPRGKVMVGRGGTASEPGSILYEAVAASGADALHALFGAYDAHK